MKPSTIMQEVTDLIQDNNIQQTLYLKEAEAYLDAFLSTYKNILEKEEMNIDDFKLLYKETVGTKTSRARNGYIATTWLLEHSDKRIIYLSSTLENCIFSYDLEPNNNESVPCKIVLSRKKKLHMKLEKLLHEFVTKQCILHEMLGKDIT